MSNEHAPLHVVAHGLAAGPNVPSLVLLHGFGATSHTWIDWLPALAARAHVLTVDLKGFGDADKPDDGAYGPADQAELVLRMLRDRGLEGVTLVGHSLGGGIALISAVRTMDDEPGRISRLVVVAGAAYRQKLPPFVAMGHRDRMSDLFMRLVGPDLLIRFVMRTIVYDPSTIREDQVRAYARPLRTPEGRRAMLRAARMILPESLDDIVRRFPELNLPTLLLWGRHDRVVPLWVGERLAAEMPQAQLEILERCGHVPPEERPEESLSFVLDFLDATDA